MSLMLARLVFGVALLVLMTQVSFAQVKNRVELGLGGLKTASYIDYLVQVTNTFTAGEESGQEDFFIMIKVNADAAFSKKELTYMDFSFEVVPSADVYDDGQTRLYAGYNLVTFKQQKNIDIDQSNQYLLSLVGFRFGGHHKFEESDVKLFGQVSVDLLSVLFDSKRHSDGVALSGKEYGSRMASSINAFLGVDFKEKLRIVMGADIMKTQALGYEVDTGLESCTPVYDEYGYYLWHDCVPITEFVYDEEWISSKLHLQATYNITKAISVFGRASYNIFKMNDYTEYFPSSYNSQWQFMIGAKVKLFQSSQK